MPPGGVVKQMTTFQQHQHTNYDNLGPIKNSYNQNNYKISPPIQFSAPTYVPPPTPGSRTTWHQSYNNEYSSNNNYPSNNSGNFPNDSNQG